MKTIFFKKITITIISIFAIIFFNEIHLQTKSQNHAYADNNIQTNADNQYDLSTTTFDLNQHFEKIEKPQDGQVLKTFVYKKVISPAIKLMGTIAVILIIIGGFTLISAQGESTGIDKGKEIIKYAIIGLIIALSSYVIVISTQSIFSGNNQEETQQ